MEGWFASISDLERDRASIVRRRYGVIETRCGQLHAIHFRPWAKLVSWPEIWPTGSIYHGRGEADRALLYYNQPRRYSNFMALKYFVSTRGTQIRTCLAALETLDQIAEIKRTDALLCDAANTRLSDRLLTRYGWESHRPQRWHRNFIKRFYGNYGGSEPTKAESKRMLAEVVGG